jgi:hypothetical protein
MAFSAGETRSKPKRRRAASQTRGNGPWLHYISTYRSGSGLISSSAQHRRRFARFARCAAPAAASRRPLTLRCTRRRLTTTATCQPRRSAGAHASPARQTGRQSPAVKLYAMEVPKAWAPTKDATTEEVVPGLEPTNGFAINASTPNLGEPPGAALPLRTRHPTCSGRSCRGLCDGRGAGAPPPLPSNPHPPSTLRTHPRPAAPPEPLAPVLENLRGLGPAMKGLNKLLGTNESLPTLPGHHTKYTSLTVLVPNGRVRSRLAEWGGVEICWEPRTGRRHTSCCGSCWRSGRHLTMHPAPHPRRPHPPPGHGPPPAAAARQRRAGRRGGGRPAARGGDKVDARQPDHEPGAWGVSAAAKGTVGSPAGRLLVACTD